MRKAFKIFFFVQFAFLILALGYLSYSGNQLRTEHDRLAAKYGRLQVDDPNKYLVCFVESESPKRELNWRVYHPPLDSVLGSLILEARPRARRVQPLHGLEYGDIRISAKFRFQDDAVKTCVAIGGFTSVRSLGPSAVAPFLKEHWNDLEFAVLADEMPLEFNPDQILNCLLYTSPSPRD